MKLTIFGATGRIGGHLLNWAAALPGLPEPLTGRELDVLRLIAAGKSNQRIARELVVTLTPSRSMSATSWTSSARPTAPRRSPGHGNCE